MIFYAIVCGVLGWAAPSMGQPLVRLTIGAVVGIAAAALLPVVRGLFG